MQSVFDRAIDEANAPLEPSWPIGIKLVIVGLVLNALWLLLLVGGTFEVFRWISR